MTIRNRRLTFVTIGVALVLGLWLTFFVQFLYSHQPTEAQIQTAARYEFERKSYAFATSWNEVIRDYQDGKADVRKYRTTAKLWEKLYADPGWLK